MASVLQGQRRCMSASRVLHGTLHTRMHGDRSHAVNVRRKYELMGKAYAASQPNVVDPLRGNWGRNLNYVQNQRWDRFGYDRGVTTFGQRGMAGFSMILNNKRTRKFVYRQMTGATATPYFRMFAPRWMNKANEGLPFAKMVPPGYRPFTEWPTYMALEYSPWFDYPEVRNASPVLNVPEIATRFAEDRAKKLELMRYNLSSGNFRTRVSVRQEQWRGEFFVGPKNDQFIGNAGPSAFTQFNSTRADDGEFFGAKAGRGTFPRPNTRHGG